VGSEEYNLKLSEKRAKSVMDFLITEGVTAERMELKGYGMSQPVASTRSPRDVRRTAAWISSSARNERKHEPEDRRPSP